MKRFEKCVPASAMGPAFKLSLPYDVVTKHLAHLVGKDFELASSASSEQCWTAQVLPRRNKDRSEFTLRGWRLFAEAHSVQVGDTLSFELVHPQRLVVRKVKQRQQQQQQQHTQLQQQAQPQQPQLQSLQQVPEASPPSPFRCRANEAPQPAATPAAVPVAEPAAVPAAEPAVAPVLAGTAPDVKPFEAFESYPAAAEPKLLERIIEEAAVEEEADETMGSPRSVSGAWNTMDDWLGVQASVADSSLVPPASPDSLGERDHPSAGMLMAMDEPAGLLGASSWPGLPELGHTNSDLSCQTQDRRKSADYSLPSGPLALGPRPQQPAGSTWGSPNTATVPYTGACPPIVSQGAVHGGLHTSNSLQRAGSSSSMRTLSNDVKRFELRAERAEREEVQLRLQLTQMRDELGKCLHALGGLERNVHDLCADKLEMRGEALKHCYAIKRALWRVTSTDI